MDAGLAAVIAGAAGAGGAALAAFGTSFGLLKQAKLQGDQAHKMWLRNHQQEAFEAIVQAADLTEETCIEQLGRIAHNRAAEAPAAEAIEVIREHSRTLRACTHRVMILSKGEVRSSALHLCLAGLNMGKASIRMIRNFSAAGVSHSETEISELAEAVSRARTEFLDEAHEALQNT
ncbi:hypothetical protein [Streptomyces microflavus]